MTVDPQSNQVVVRMTYSINWLSKPFGIWNLVRDAIESKVKDSEKVFKEWFPARANEYIAIHPTPISMMVYQNTLEPIDKMQITPQSAIHIKSD